MRAFHGEPRECHGRSEVWYPKGAATARLSWLPRPDDSIDLWSFARVVMSRWEDASRAVYTSAGTAFRRSSLLM